MRAYEFTDSFSLENLKLTDRPSPEPGLGQAVVRVRACSINYRDLLVAKGSYGRSAKTPLIPLSDGAGEVTAVGAGVSRVKVGDRVAGIFMQTWLEGPPDDAKVNSAMGGAIHGMLAEEVCLNADGLVHFPAHLSYEEAAALPCAAVTAWNALFDSGNLRGGQTVLVQGTGGVSLFALQFAKMAGARVIAISSSDEKLVRARTMGADETVNYRAVPGWDKPIRQMTDGVGVDHVVEVGGAGTLALSMKTVRRGGHIALIGVLSGAGEVDPRPLLAKSIRLQGIYVGSRQMFQEMNRGIVQSNMHPVIDRVFAFEEARQALEHMQSGAHFGKICIRID